MNFPGTFDCNSAADDDIDNYGINIFGGPESHVAQQRRRDKLRNNAPQSPTHHLQDIRNHLLLHQVPPTDPFSSGLNLDHDPPMFSSSEMLNFTLNRNSLLAHNRDPLMRQLSAAAAQSLPPIMGHEDASFTNSSRAVSSSLLAPMAMGRVSASQIPSYWKGCDWVCNYNSRDNASNQDLLFVGGVLPPAAAVKEVNFSSSSSYGCNAAANSAGATSKKCGSSSVFHNSQTHIPPAIMGSQRCEMISHFQQNVPEASWLGGDENEMVSHPSYEKDAHVSRVYDSDTSVHRLVEGWDAKFGMTISKSRWDVDTSVSNPTSRGLSLSLSSHPSPTYNTTHLGQEFGFENVQTRTGVISSTAFHNSKSSNSSCSYSDSKSSIINDGSGSSLNGNVGGSSTYSFRSTGPLGPFTGYATILKNSKFLKPAQRLLDEICNATGSILVKTCEFAGNDFTELSVSHRAENDSGGRNSALSSSFNSPSEVVGEDGSVTGSCQTYRAVFQQKKAKLLFMQEEICRKYKQYHQQMKMVVASFESVVGLSSATPYTSLALKSVSKHFRFLKNAISDQLRHICKALGEDMLSPSTGTSSKGGIEIPQFRCIDQNLQKQMSDSLGPQRPIWRPQRGLPERAVAVLRAWLFEHFLHPYPTDNDKEMLANQTGLSRNQVSNWFINARVRVWKPMVEEMHMLESNGSAETEANLSKNNQKPDGDNIFGEIGDLQFPNTPKKDQMSGKQPQYSSVDGEEGGSVEQWSREKRSRIGCKSTGADGSSMGFLPYHRALGAVSLTLGLRHNTDQQREHQQRKHYEGQMVHDSVR